jgi:RimJ/RimL family protein N-acetyltransferase
MTIPVLQTERLILREYRLGDFPAHAAIWADPRTTRDFDGYVYQEDQCWQRFLANFGLWRMFGYGLWGIEEKESGRYIGVMEFLQAKRAIDVPYREAPEAAWLIAPDRHQRGLAREGLTAVFAWADAHIAAPETWCMINPANIVSQKVAARFGYRRAQDSRYQEKPMQTYLRSRGAVA